MSPQVKSSLLLAGIFIIGAVTGSALTVGLASHFMHAPGGGGSANGGDMKSHLMTHLTHKLNLTPDQQARIQPIVADAAAKLQALHHDEMRQGSQIFKAADEQISALLTPEQQVEMKKLEDEREKTFPGGHKYPGGGFHHGSPDDQAPPPQPPAPSASEKPSPPPQ